MNNPTFSLQSDHILILDQQIRIERAGDLLERYVQTDDNAPLMASLRPVRDHYLSDLDQIASPAEVVGLIAWLLRDNNIQHQGESFAETADRLCDLDNNTDSTLYSTLIYHLRDAIERLDDLALFED